MNISEIKIQNKELTRRYVYHLVPEDVFLSCLNVDGSYDCRSNKEWGMGADFIHTSNSKKILKTRVADWRWSKYSLDKKFVLLKININYIESEITYAVYNGIKYYHIYGKLPAKSFVRSKVERYSDGTFIL